MMTTLWTSENAFLSLRSNRHELLNARASARAVRNASIANTRVESRRECCIKYLLLADRDSRVTTRTDPSHDNLAPSDASSTLYGDKAIVTSRSARIRDRIRGNANAKRGRGFRRDDFQPTRVYNAIHVCAITDTRVHHDTSRYRKVNRETRFRAALSRILNAFLTQIYSVRVSGLLDLAATYVIIHIARLAR